MFFLRVAIGIRLLGVKDVKQMPLLYLPATSGWDVSWMLLDVHKTHHSAPQPNVTSMGASPVASGENLGLKVKDGIKPFLALW